jgi:hypothetical protein
MSASSLRTISAWDNIVSRARLCVSESQTRCSVVHVYNEKNPSRVARWRDDAKHMRGDMRVCEPIGRKV